MGKTDKRQKMGSWVVELISLSLMVCLPVEFSSVQWLLP